MIEPSTTARPLTAGNELVDLEEAYRVSNIKQVLDEVDQELVGLLPIKARMREIASLLLIARLREQMGITTERAALHRQDHRGAAHGQDSAQPRLRPAWARDRGHARRPGRPVRRAHGAQDQ